MNDRPSWFGRSSRGISGAVVDHGIDRRVDDRDEQSPTRDEHPAQFRERAGPVLDIVQGQRGDDNVKSVVGVWQWLAEVANEQVASPGDRSGMNDVIDQVVALRGLGREERRAVGDAQVGLGAEPFPSDLDHGRAQVEAGDARATVT